MACPSAWNSSASRKEKTPSLTPGRVSQPRPHLSCGAASPSGPGLPPLPEASPSREKSKAAPSWAAQNQTPTPSASEAPTALLPWVPGQANVPVSSSLPASSSPMLATLGQGTTIIACFSCKGWHIHKNVAALAHSQAFVHMANSHGKPTTGLPGQPPPCWR